MRVCVFRKKKAVITKICCMVLKAERLNNDLMAQRGSFTHTLTLSVCLHVTPAAFERSVPLLWILKEKNPQHFHPRHTITVGSAASLASAAHNRAKISSRHKWSPNSQSSDVTASICPQSSGWCVRTNLQNFKVPASFQFKLGFFLGGLFGWNVNI